MQPTDEAIDDARTVLFGGMGELCVACGGGGTGMAEQRLNVAQAQALFEQMRGEGMAQGMNGGFFLMPQSASVFFIAVCTPPRSIG
jgi:hypothetical protein